MLRKLFLVLTILAVGGMCIEVEELVKKWTELTAAYHEKCMKESQVQLADLEKLMSISDVPPSKQLACYINCIYEALELFDDNHEFKKTALLDKFSYMDERALVACIPETRLQTDHCAKSITFVHCLIKGILLSHA
ncbi:hypothetical protein FQA39_LY10004 [Lamprigera yunnana]|nr:hypothetical protein FQA39_LY10004 [Lamprigera yunnana]